MSKKKINISENSKDEIDFENADDVEINGNAEPVGEMQADEVSEEKEETNDEKYIRLAADFQNYKRRALAEKDDIYKFANEKIVTDMLSVLDNFERAIDGAKDSADKALADGVSLIYKQFKDILEKFGTLEINALAENFDPNVHHAVMVDKSSEGESGKVTEVLQKGYTLNGRVIRPAMVKVAE